MSNDGGDFLGGVPKACFRSANPCAGVDGDKSLLSREQQMANLDLVIKADAAGDSHLDVRRQANQATSPVPSN